MPTVNLTLTGQAFASVNDTNVTLTLGGTPLTALLKGVSITAGWTGQLSIARGGTGLGSLGTANQLLRVNALGTALEYFTPSYGSGTVTGVLVASANGFTGTSDGNAATPTLTLTTSLNTPVLAGNGTALIAATTTGSGSTVVLNNSPTFITDISAPKIISSTASAGLLLCNNNGVTVASFGVGSAGSTNIGLIGATAVTGTLSATGALTLGLASTTAGQLTLSNATNAFTQTIRGTNPSASIIYDLPTTAPTLGQVLSATAPAAGVVTLSWATASSGITVGATTSNGANGRLLFSLSGVVNESASVYIDQSGTNFDVRLGRQIGAGGVGYTGSSNVLIGHWVGYNMTSGGDNVFIGNGAAGVGSSLSNGGENVAVGSGAMNNAGNQFYTTAIGYRAGYGSTPFRGVYVGHNAGNGNANQGIIIGFDPPNTTAAHQCIIGSNDANGYISDYFLNGVTHTAPYSTTIHASHGSGTNVAGANMTLDGGNATGNAASGFLKVTTGVKGASGTTLQTSSDRLAVIGKYVDLTESAATTFANLALTTSGTTSGGTIIYAIEATDGTDYQNTSGRCNYSVVNKAGTLTFALSADTQSTAASAGTLTGTLSLAASGTTLQFQMNAVSSLAQTVLRISFQVLNQFGVATITAA